VNSHPDDLTVFLHFKSGHDIIDHRNEIYFDSLYFYFLKSQINLLSGLLVKVFVLLMLSLLITFAATTPFGLGLYLVGIVCKDFEFFMTNTTKLEKENKRKVFLKI